MKRFTVSTLLALLATFSFSTAFAEYHQGQRARPGQLPTSAEVGSVQSAGSLIGLPIHGQQGERIGLLQDVMIDLDRNRIGYGVVEVEGTQHLVPWTSISSDLEDAALTLNADRQTVVAAPVAPFPAQIDENYGRQVHEHFGVAPYWEELEFQSPEERPYEPWQTPAREVPLPGQPETVEPTR